MVLPKTSQQYFIFVNVKELYDNYITLGKDNVVLAESETLSDSEMKILIESEKKVFFVWYYSEETDGIYDFPMIIQMQETFRNAGRHLREYIACITSSRYGTKDRESFVIAATEDCVKVEKLADQYGIVVHTDYTNRCGNCREEMEPMAKYCKNCGTKRGKGKFEPYTNAPDILYGCPNLYKTMCPVCNKEFVGWTYQHHVYCDICGRELEYKVEKSGYELFFDEQDEYVKGVKAEFKESINAIDADNIIIVNSEKLKAEFEKRNINNVVFVETDERYTVEDKIELLNESGKTATVFCFIGIYGNYFHMLIDSYNIKNKYFSNYYIKNAVTGEKGFEPILDEDDFIDFIFSNAEFLFDRQCEF